MSDRLTPEERAEQLAAAILEWGGCFDCCSDDGTAFDRVCPGDGWINDRLAPALHGLVEAVRADERAKVLAGFEVERADRMVARRVPCDCPGDWQHHGRFVGDDGPETHASFEAVPSRRLVGPWEPAEEGA